jgi:hypothetical protein
MVSGGSLRVDSRLSDSVEIRDAAVSVGFHRRQAARQRQIPHKTVSSGFCDHQSFWPRWGTAGHAVGADADLSTFQQLQHRRQMVHVGGKLPNTPLARDQMLFCLE